MKREINVELWKGSPKYRMRTRGRKNREAKKIIRISYQIHIFFSLYVYESCVIYIYI